MEKKYAHFEFDVRDLFLKVVTGETKTEKVLSKTTGGTSYN